MRNIKRKEKPIKSFSSNLDAFQLTKKQKEVCTKILSKKAPYILLYGGSRSGKTTLAVYLSIFAVLWSPNTNVLWLRKHVLQLKSAILDQTLKKLLLSWCPDLLDYISNSINNDLRVIRFPNGSNIWFEGLTNSRKTEDILGREYSMIFLSEANQTNYSVFVKLVSRIAESTSDIRQTIILDCNPTSKLSWLYKLFILKKDPETLKPLLRPEFYESFLMNPDDNPHLDKRYMEVLDALGERGNKRFRKGQWLDHISGAHWTQDLIEECRIPFSEAPTKYDEIIIGVDPAVSSNEKSNETGIIVVGIREGIGYVLEDCSGKYTPNGWAMKVVNAYRRYNANYVVCEKNNGGDLLESQIKKYNRHIRYKGIHASQAKGVRAEPLVTFYERGKIKHVCDNILSFSDLETQMTTWTKDGENSTDSAIKQMSPDRIDALVHAFHELTKFRPTVEVY